MNKNPIQAITIPADEASTDDVADELIVFDDVENKRVIVGYASGECLSFKYSGTNSTIINESNKSIILFSDGGGYLILNMEGINDTGHKINLTNLCL